VLQTPVRHQVDEGAARRTLRAQIARLERELATAVISTYPRLPVGSAGAGHAGPRLLGLGELERTRDALAARVAAVREQAADQAERQEQARLLIEAMLQSPREYKWVRVCNADIGEPGCKHWHVVPRLGLVGMLAGWWHVKISSGCPLAA
jgi:ParB-like chromosome segregation protein Spo0J